MMTIFICRYASRRSIIVALILSILSSTWISRAVAELPITLNVQGAKARQNGADIIIELEILDNMKGPKGEKLKVKGDRIDAKVIIDSSSSTATLKPQEFYADHISKCVSKSFFIEGEFRDQKGNQQASFELIPEQGMDFSGPPIVCTINGRGPCPPNFFVNAPGMPNQVFKGTITIEKIGNDIATYTELKARLSDDTPCSPLVD